ncbi:MAG: M48 family metallopeptidase [Deltaproteobacteria bacterium]
MLRVIIRLFVLALILMGCATAPYTKREQLILVSQSEAVTLGTNAYGEILKTSKLSHNEAIVNQVRRVGRSIAEVADREFPDVTKGYKWEFNVIESKEPNAFALPGGKVAVYTGILKYTENEAGLATVIAHEIAHVIARHGSERMSQQLLVELGAAGLSAALHNESSLTTQAILSAFGIGTTVGVLLPFSRAEESEADHIGLILMAKAGYDPRQALLFWQRMANAEEKGQKPPAFLSTHPADKQRIADIKKWLPQAMGYYRE